MIAVIFEVTPHEGRYDDYLAIAGDLKPVLEPWMALSRSNGFKA